MGYFSLQMRHLYCKSTIAQNIYSKKRYLCVISDKWVNHLLTHFFIVSFNFSCVKGLVRKSLQPASSAALRS